MNQGESSLMRIRPQHQQGAEAGRVNPIQRNKPRLIKLYKNQVIIWISCCGDVMTTHRKGNRTRTVKQNQKRRWCVDVFFTRQMMSIFLNSGCLFECQRLKALLALFVSDSLSLLFSIWLKKF